MEPLTPREAEIARMIARGLSPKSVAAELQISEHMVREHIQNAAAKLPGKAAPKFKLVLFVLRLDKSA